jgi:hypothetical protein
MVKMYCELMDHPGYLAADAARLVGVPGDRIGQWARWGHISASVSAAEPHVYSFADVADALAVHLLLRAGHSLRAIRRAAERRSLSAGGAVFATFGALPLDGEVDARSLLSRGGWPTLITEVTCVWVDPARCLGVPCVRGTRVPVSDAVADPGAYGIGAGTGLELRRWWDASAAA